MIKRAAIYVRVSSERQATDKISPDAQESDCRLHCQHQDYQVVEIYRDIEKYRVNGKLIEPSGTRADRPQLKRMLADARASKFEVIVAWREDRLYRGYRPMLDVLDCIDETRVEIELVKESFDKRLAPVKAWAARMELDAKQDRITMGIAGRLANGKVWSTSIPYGYRLESGMAQINPQESEWLHRIWRWYGDDVPIREIRRRLMDGGAPQRETNRIPWQIPWIYILLKKEVYTTGIQYMRWSGQVYEIPYPIIIDPETAAKVQARREKSKGHPARNVKYNYLGMGLVYCAACNIKMTSFTSKAYKNGKPTDRLVRDYRCGHFLAGYHEPGCPHRISVKRLDSQLWEKVWALLDDSENLELALQDRLEELRQVETGTEQEIQRLYKELDQLQSERQWLITRARKGVISEEDLGYQLAQITAQEKLVRAELEDKSLMVGNRGEQLLEFAEEYRQRLREGLDWLKDDEIDPGAAAVQFEARRKMVEGIVRRVNVFEDKSIQVEFIFDLSGEDVRETPPWWQ
jgi:site-specific DNA recombinase